MVKIEGSFELSHMEWLPDKNDMNLYFSDGSDIVGTEQDDHLYGTPNNDLIRGMGGDDYIEALGGDDEIYGGDGDEDIRIQAGNSKIYGGLGWDTLEIDDKTSDYVTITYTDGENGIVQGYNSDGVEFHLSEFESINRIVQVSEIDFRYSGGENNDSLKLYEMPLANPEDGYFTFDGGDGRDRLQLYNLPLPTDGDEWSNTTSVEFNEIYAFEHISGSISDFKLTNISDGETLGIFNSFEEVQFEDDEFSLWNLRLTP